VQGKATSSLEAKMQKEGEKEERIFEEFLEWCDSTSQNLTNEIKNEGELKDATAIRDKEAADFAASIYIYIYTSADPSISMLGG
jgi:hypothetical protein